MAPARRTLHPRSWSLLSAVTALVVAPMLTLPAAASGCPTAVANPTYSGGDGVSTPYEISTREQLLGLGLTTADWGSDFVITADIDLDGCVWSEIGDSLTAFTGVFDGGGFTVRNLGQNASPKPEGFFGRAENATIRDLRIIDADIAGAGAGVLARQVFGTSVENVHVTGNVAGSDYVGGLIGYADAFSATRAAVSISDSSADVSITGRRDVGGLVGELAGDYSGILGPTITRSSASGSIVATGSYVGGLVGALWDDAVISDSFTTMDVEGADHVGGLFGFADWSSGTTRMTMTGVYSTGVVEAMGGAGTVGGLVGYLAGGNVSTAYARGRVLGLTDTGGLVGFDGGNVTVGTDAYWDTTTTGQSSSRGGGTAATTAQLTSIGTFASWPIVAGWAPYVANTTVWGICSQVNDGYPFLLWEYGADPCTVPVAVPSLAVSCSGPDGGGLAGGVVVSCTVSGGDPEIDLVWRAAYNPVFAEGVVRTGADGTGVFSFVVPVAAAGSPVTVELVAWTAPIPVGTAVAAVGGPVPSSVPSGGGPSPVLPAVPLLVAVVAVVTRLRALRIRTPMSAPSNV